MQFTHHADDHRRWDEVGHAGHPGKQCLRGGLRPLLPETAEVMRNRGPRAVVVDRIAGCDTPGALNTPESSLRWWSASSRVRPPPAAPAPSPRRRVAVHVQRLGPVLSIAPAYLAGALYVVGFGAGGQRHHAQRCGGGVAAQRGQHLQAASCRAVACRAARGRAAGGALKFQSRGVAVSACTSPICGQRCASSCSTSSTLTGLSST